MSKCLTRVLEPVTADSAVRRRRKLIFEHEFLEFNTSNHSWEWGKRMAYPEEPKSKRGFASMDPEKRREIAKKGGAAVPNEKRSFSTSKSLAVSAGRKGGAATPSSKRAYSRDRDLAAKAGRIGGIASQKKK